ncbi:MAG: heparin lyase I family protein [Pseudomonadales bacterium]|nr:heparin lyase I family protein [Pseudomonadales bacterium]
MLKTCILLFAYFFSTYVFSQNYYDEQDWENGIPLTQGSGWVISESTDPNSNQADDIIDTVTWPVHSGAKSLRSRVINSTGHNNRAEISNTHTADLFEQYFYRFSVYLPSSDYPKPGPGQWALFAQWQQHPDEGEPYRNPPLAFAVNQNGDLVIVGRYTETHIVSSSWATTQFYLSDVRDNNTTFNLPKDQWITFEVSVRWDYSENGNGFIDIWQDGEQIVNHSDPIGYNDTTGPYIKLGVYRDVTIQTTQTAYYDNFQILRNGIIVYADEDATVRGGIYQNSNFGSDSYLTLKHSTNSDYKYFSFLHFEHSRFNDYVSNGGYLLLHALNPPNVTGNISLKIYSNNWSENTITKISSGGLSKLHDDLWAVPDGNEVLEWFRSNEVDVDDGETTMRLMLHTPDDYMSFYSSETGVHTRRPILLLELDN